MLLFITNYRKRIAFAFLVLFFLDLCCPAIAAEQAPLFQYERRGNSNYNAWSFHEPAVKYNSIAEFSGGSGITHVKNDQPDIDGPGQPEMKSFQSVNADNMVDLFTGDFSYNIPLLDVGGYPVNLHYTSGITMDQEASWVGLGWNVNPGSISRSMRGLPDDFDGLNDSITKTQFIKENRTIGVTIEPSVEVLGMPLNVSARLGVFYNNYRGYGLETGVGIGGTAKTSFGSLTGNLSISNNSQEGIRVNPSISAKFANEESDSHLQGSLGLYTGYSSRTGISSLQIDGGIQSDQYDSKKLQSVLGGGPLATISFAKPAYTPSVNMPIRNNAYSFTGKVGIEVFGTNGAVSFTGYVNTQDIAPEDVTQSIPAAGYLYATNGNGRENILLDFNREKDMDFNYKTTPHVALPQYTYDAFTISGEGTGGSFRPYRGDIGYAFDHNIASRSSSTTGSIDAGSGTLAHGGIEVTNITTNTTNHRWNQLNNIEPKLGFQSSDLTYESVYFRNPGEKTTNSLQYYHAIGGDSLVRVKLAGSKDHVYAESALIRYTDEGKADAEIAVTDNLVKKQRDKRTQVISYLTAQDAAILGLDKMIKSYKENTIPIGNCTDTITEISRVDNQVRKKNHLSEISVLNSDGRKYVYGLPIYNKMQEDVTFAVDNKTGTPDLATGLIHYTPGVDNKVDNGRGKDSYYSKEKIPAYSHNFLLTGIVSPDYVDITGNGISEDDPGDAVRFNYTQVYGEKQGYYKWRTPFASNYANYNEGLKTNDQDNKATYIYGEKEMWYLNSIESKTMIAVFHVANDRSDAYEVADENGGQGTARSRRLERIDLYVKADLIRNGATKAKPVKTVHFDYSYELCKGWQGNSESGKLTLKKVWFTYNKNNKGELNPYVFNYHPNSEGNPDDSYNPSYNARNSDRWGTYKSSSDNPNEMNNGDYPYSIQNGTAATANASAWDLTDIKLPSGGKMHVTYESDDYAYVQNKRAAQMTAIAGINTPSGYNLYANGGTEYYTIYVNTPGVTLKNKADLRSKYLDIDDIVYFKLAVNIPKTNMNDAEHQVEMVPGYGTIADYGITPGNDHQFWIRLAPVEGKSPMVRAALQYLRLNLPAKAYPNSEGIDNLGLLNIIKMLATSFSEVKNMVMSFDGAAKDRHWCQSILLDRSFVRLSNPDFKKYGGGYRVKRIEILDNWKTMTNNVQRESVYGQEYTYTTTEDVNGQMKTISSGVATWEPGIGSEENQFKRPINYIEKLAPMAPVNFMFSEEPLGENFFPSPMVGYSTVSVRTINAKAKSANGWQQTDFYTSRDFPTVVQHSLLEENRSKFKYETSSNILRLNHKNYVTLSQGFLVELNDMNGKMKAQYNYAETDPEHPIAYTLNFYKVDNDKVTNQHLNNDVWVVDSATGTVNTHGVIGKDIELMADLREQDSKANTIGFSPNLDLIPFIPPFIPVLPIPSAFHLPQKEEVRYRSAALVKVIQRYGILDSVVVMDKGSVVSTKNLVYDGGTGNVILSRTNNEFNDPVYNFNYPAYWAYSGMGQAYKNIGAIFQTKLATAGFQLNKGILYKEGSIDRYPTDDLLESGDELYVYKAKKATTTDDCRRLNVISPEINWSGRLWVIDAAKGHDSLGHVDKGLYFIDSLGRIPPDMLIDRMMITRSGKRNMSDVSAGNVVMLNNPIREVGSQLKIVIDTNARVLNASAATFKDMWRVENSEYQEDSCYTVVSSDSVILNPAQQAAVFRESYVHLKNGNIGPNNLGNIYTNHFAASVYKRHYNGGGNRYAQFKARSILKFDFGGIKAGATITNAVLELHAMAPRKLWEKINDSYLDDFPSRTKAHFENGDLTGPKTNETMISQASAWSLSSDPWAVVSLGSLISLGRKGDFTCTDATVNVTSLVSAMAASPSTNNGFLLETKDWGNPYEFNSSDRTQSYCGSAPVYSRNTAVPPTVPPVENECINCTMPTLKVNYSYIKDTCIKICRKNITDSATNPYRWGILGNWRMDRSYVYYNSRQETDASIKASNIRIEGTLKNFMPYWFFASPALQPNNDSTRWVWNSVIDNFNRKGFEIENHDALGRYNAGLYGYNQTLPVAVAQNSRYRELLFDGFEDYGYKTTYCATCPPKREFDFLGNSGVDTTRIQSHTGLYSIKVNSGSEAVLTVPVDTIAVTDTTSLLAAIDTSHVNILNVVGAGTGLNGKYYMGKTLIANICQPKTTDAPHTRTDPAVNFNWGNSAPVTLGNHECSDFYKIDWTGTVQPRYTDDYTFYFNYSGTATILIDGVKVDEATAVQTGERRTKAVPMMAGHLYNITISYTKKYASPAWAILSWSSKVSQAKEIVPAKFLYPASTSLADTTGSIEGITQYDCVQAKTVQPRNVIRGKFSPLTKTKLTISAWVRLDVEDCNNTPALDEVIQVNFGAEDEGTWLKKTGVRIEGWQRYEANVDMPDDPSTMYVRLRTAESTGIFVDDIRIQSFNSSMKSFVYNPVNLRLMAELDENNYASFYEYDDDGTLIRVKKETERGIMTIQETRSALFKDN